MLLAPRGGRLHPLPGRRRARLHAAAPPRACAASGWPRATRSSPRQHPAPHGRRDRRARGLSALCQRRGSAAEAAGEERGARPRDGRDRRSSRRRASTSSRPRRSSSSPSPPRAIGKRSSAYEYRITGRGGQGIANIETPERNGDVVASFPVGTMRPDHAGDRRRPAHPLPGPRHPHRRPQDPGRGAVQGGRGRDGWSPSPGSAREPSRSSGKARKDRRPTPRPRIAIYPGTFDPITNGHLDIIRRAARLVDHLSSASRPNAGKGPLFAVDERVAHGARPRSPALDLNNGNGAVEVRGLRQPAHAFRRSPWAPA